MAAAAYALSIKQPWATLLVHGRKCIEVRRWSTARRGRILIHAARFSDSRPEAWEHVSTELSIHAQQVGGIIGAAELIDCTTYGDVHVFAADQNRHLNDPEWFQPPILYGFVFQRAEPLPFRTYSGWVRFFRVDLPELNHGQVVG